MPANKFRGLRIAGVVLILVALLPWIPTQTRLAHKDFGAAFDGVLAVFFSASATVVGMALIIAARLLRKGSSEEILHRENSR